MSDPDTYIQDIELLGRGLIPRHIQDILIDRSLAESASIKNNRYHFLNKGKFSDLIKSDLSYVYRNKAPQLRPIISSLGGGKSTLLVQIEDVAKEVYKDRATVVKINMSAYPGIDEAHLVKFVYKEIFIKIRPQIRDMLKEIGKNLYVPYLNQYLIDDLLSDDKRVEDKAFQQLIGESRSDDHDNNYFLAQGAKSFLIELFNKSNRMLVLLFDEVDMFVRANKISRPSSIDIFTYLFLRDLTDHSIESRPIYVVFTSEKEMYEYIRLNCQNFQRVADTHEVLMKEFSDAELRLLADNIFLKIISPLFGRKQEVKQLPEQAINDLIVQIRIGLNNKTTPGNFTKHYINKYFDYFDIGFDMLFNMAEEYEACAFEEFQRMVKSQDVSFMCTRHEIVQGHNFDGYAKVLNKSTISKRAYGEFTMTEAHTEKVNKFISWINNLKESGDYDPTKDEAIFISPSITGHARDKLTNAKIQYHPLDNTTISIKEIIVRINNKKDIPVKTEPIIPPTPPVPIVPIVENNMRETITKKYSGKVRRKFKTIKAENKGLDKDELLKLMYELKNDNLIRAIDDVIDDDTYITFKK